MDAILHTFGNDKLLIELFTALLAGIIVTIIPLMLRAFKIIREGKDKNTKELGLKNKVILFINNFFPSWQTLKSISNNSIFRTSYLWFIIVPIIAKLLSSTEKGANITLQSFPELNITLSVPFSWNMFYFGSLSFVIAGILFSIRSPVLIKKYENFRDFMKKENSGVAIINDVEKSLETTKERDEFYNIVSYHYSWLEGKVFYSKTNEKEELRMNSMMSSSPEEMAHLYAISSEYLDRKFLVSRVLTSIFYYLSFSFYGAVIFEQSYFVIEEFIKG